MQTVTAVVLEGQYLTICLVMSKECTSERYSYKNMKCTRNWITVLYIANIYRLILQREEQVHIAETWPVKVTLESCTCTVHCIKMEDFWHDRTWRIIISWRDCDIQYCDLLWNSRCNFNLLRNFYRSLLLHLQIWWRTYYVSTRT